MAEEIEGLISFRYHDSYYRKRLYLREGSLAEFELIRAEVRIKSGKEVLIRNVTIYPCDVVYYVRRTLEVVEDIVEKKVKEQKSYKEVEDYCFLKYEIKSIKPILQAMRRVSLAFNRLLTSKLISFRTFTDFISQKVKDLTFYNLIYQNCLSKAGLGLLGLFRI